MIHCNYTKQLSFENTRNKQTTLVKSPYKPCLNYKRDFDPDKKISEHIMVVKFTRSLEVQKTQDYGTIIAVPINWIIQRKELICMYQGEILEEVLHTINQSKNKANDMKMSSGKMWEEWSRI